MKSVPENIQPCKDLFPQFPWSTECLTLHPAFPSAGAEGQQLQQRRAQCLQRQEAGALAAVRWLANTLGKRQFVVDATLLSNILRHGFPFTFLHKYHNQQWSYDQLSYGGLLWYIPLELGAQNIEAFCGSFGLPWWLRWSRICLQCRRPGFNPGVGKIHWRREWLPTAVFLPGECHGQRSLAGLGSQRLRPD